MFALLLWSVRASYNIKEVAIAWTRKNMMREWMFAQTARDVKNRTSTYFLSIGHIFWSWWTPHPTVFIWVFPEMAYTQFMITCMLHFLESYPESCPRIIPANHTTNHTHDFEAMFWNIRFLNWIGKSWWSSPVAVKSCVQFLCQTMSPEWLSTQDVHFLGKYFTELYFFILPKTVARPKHTSNHTPWCNTLCWVPKGHIYTTRTKVINF